MKVVIIEDERDLAELLAFDCAELATAVRWLNGSRALTGPSAGSLVVHERRVKACLHLSSVDGCTARGTP